MLSNGLNHHCAALSTLELASAYTMFPDGLLRRPTAFAKIFRNVEEISVIQNKPENVVNA